jgi:hypothetical protein
MQEFSWTDEVFHRIKKENTLLHTIKKIKVNLIGHILHRKSLIKHIIEEKIEGAIEVTGGQGRRCKDLLDDHMETRGYWRLQMEALGLTLWRTHF